MMRTAAVLSAALALAGCARPAGGPVPEREFQYVATNSGRTACDVWYHRKGEDAEVDVGQVPGGGRVSFTVLQPERGVTTVLRAHCGDRTYTHDLRPGRRYVSLTRVGRGEAGRPCEAPTASGERDPDCARERDRALHGGRRVPATDGGDGVPRPIPPPVKPSTDP